MNEMLLLLQQSPIFLGLVLFILGACVGSFLNVVIFRLPGQLFHQWNEQCREMLSLEQQVEIDANEAPPNLLRPASHCPNCLKPLLIIHNIPILSYLFLGAKCGFCKNPVSIRYPIVELLTVVLSVHIGIVFGMGWPLAFALVFIYVLIALSAIDIDHQILPDILVLPLLWIGLLANCFEIFTDLRSAVFGAIIGYGALWIIYQIHHKLTGKQGMGYGDFKLLAAIGAWLGWQMLPVVVLLASISGTVLAILLVVLKKQGRDVPIPFGPYLAVAGWVALIWGSSILNNYLQIFNL